MKDSTWIAKGTTSFPRWDGRTYTVIPSTSFFLAMYNPKTLVEQYGYPQDEIDYLTDFICGSLDYDQKRFENPTVKVSPKADSFKRDLGVKITSDDIAFYEISSDEEDVFYGVTLMNLMLPRINRELPRKEDVIREVENFKVLDYSCGCGRGTTIDQYCSMPFDYISPWGVSAEEYDRSFKDETVAKYYGKVACKHVLKGLNATGRYNIFDDDAFQSKLYRMTKALSAASKEREKMTQKEMDIILNPHIHEIGLGDILEYFRKKYKARAEIEPVEERLVRKLGRPR